MKSPASQTFVSGMGISIIKIRRSWDRLIFIIGIPIQVRQHLHNKTVPSSVLLTLWQEIPFTKAQQSSSSGCDDQSKVYQSPELSWTWCLQLMLVSRYLFCAASFIWVSNVQLTSQEARMTAILHNIVGSGAIWIWYIIYKITISSFYRLGIVPYFIIVHSSIFYFENATMTYILKLSIKSTPIKMYTRVVLVILST